MLPSGQKLEELVGFELVNSKSLEFNQNVDIKMRSFVQFVSLKELKEEVAIEYFILYRLSWIDNNSV